MMARALQQRWPIKPEHKQEIIDKLLRVLSDATASPREITAAAKALMAAESQNQADEHKVIDVGVATRNDRLDAIAADLGIDPSLIQAIEGEADSGTESIAALQASDQRTR
jgi:hypothetical protein